MVCHMQVVYFEGEAHICVQRGAIWLNGYATIVKWSMK